MPTKTWILPCAASLLLAACGNDVPPSAALPSHALPATVASTSLPQARSAYAVTRDAGGAYAVRLLSDGSVTAVAPGITAIRFADMTANLTVADTVKAVSAADLQAIVELYIAYFNRLPDADGLEYWARQYLGGQKLDQIGASFYAAAIQYSDLTGYTASMSNAAFVTKVYRNVLGRSPDDEGLKYWTGQLDSGLATRGTLVRDMLAAAHSFKGNATYGWVADMLDNKLRLATAFAVDQGLNYNTAADSIANTMALAAGLAPGAGFLSVQTASGDATVAASATTFDSTRQFPLLHEADSLTGMSFDVGAGVGAAQLDLLKQGYALGQSFLDAKLGGGILAATRRYVTAKVVATGRGNEENGGGGSCCTGLGDTSTTLTSTVRATPNAAPVKTTLAARISAVRPFIDVAHREWLQQGDDNIRTKVVVHEYAHGWQSTLGCLTTFSQPLGMWLNEGIAEYIGHEAMIQKGSFTREQVMALQLSYAKGSGQLSVPLRELGVTTAPYWPGNAGYLALDRLLKTAPKGLMALRSICEEAAQGASTAAAFQTAFGVSLEDFYAQFEVLRRDWNSQ